MEPPEDVLTTQARSVAVPRWIPPAGTAATIRRNVLRHAARGVLLVAVDVAAFSVLRTIVRLLRDWAILGDAATSVLRDMFPVGYFAGWQFPAALVLGLAVAGSYGRGDRRRQPERLFVGASLGCAFVLWAPLWQGGVAATLGRYAVTVALLSAGLTAFRLLFDRLLSALPAVPRMSERVIFVGDPTHPDSARIFARLVERGNVEPLAWVSNNGSRGMMHRVIGTEQFSRLIRRGLVDTVVLCGPLAKEQ